MTNPALKCICDNPADGLDGIHCQECWERLCSDLWWQVVGSVQDVLIEEGDCHE